MKTWFTSRIARHLLFWIGVFSYFIITSNMVFFKDYTHLVQSTLTLMVPQVITAYVLLDVLISKLLNQKKYLAFGLFSLLLLAILFLGYMLIRKYFFDAVYYDVYNDLAKTYAKRSLMERFMDLNLLVSKMVLFISPAALIFAFRMYKNQKNVMELREQKRIAELSALKNQLNPHFLFNTLNNLYALAVEQSSKTPEVIERLSEILDYILYRCKADFVSLDKEVAMIENYLGLEKIRYGKRVQIVFEHSVEESVKIAPLLLLTFIENAFKHGVSQELKVATVHLTLKADDQNIAFDITNTKPPMASTEQFKTEGEALGLENVTKQLELLYPNAYSLKIEDQDNQYRVQLNIPAHGL
ncbi:MAG: histidine kinase [Bacteroidota bacterium]